MAVKPWIIIAALLTAPPAWAFCRIVDCPDEARHLPTGNADLDKAVALCDDHRIARLHAAPLKSPPPGYVRPPPRDWEGEWQDTCPRIVAQWQKAGIPAAPTHYDLMQVERAQERANKAAVEKPDLDFTKGLAR